MVNFTKMHGLGNDYIFINYLDEKNVIENLNQTVRFMCNRNFGIGADGVIIVNRSKIADFKMNIYNADGTEAEMCGNGIRCFAKYVYDNKLINRKDILIETLGGIKKAYIRPSRMNKNIEEITVDMGSPIFEDGKNPKKIELEILENKITLYCVSMGNPHAIVFTKNLENLDVKKFGSIIEVDNNFPKKTNVEFVKVLGPSSIKMRVWERGTGETYACGTGACAAFVVCNKLGLTRKNIRVSLKGGDLSVSLEDISKKIYMTGIATKVFDGSIDI